MKPCVAPHRAFSTKRKADTSRVAWQQVVRPTVDRALLDYGEVCRIDYELAEGGVPIPLSWDDRALYDDKGRRLQVTTAGPQGATARGLT